METYASARGYYTYIYNPGRAGWQTVALIGPEIGEEEPEPEPVVQEYYASWEAPAQTASGSFDFSYGVRTDKIQTATLEKMDGATIESNLQPNPAASRAATGLSALPESKL